MTNEPEIVVLPTPDAVSAAAAERVADTLRDAVDARGRADWATTGGSTPIGIYRHLAVPPLRDVVPWEAVHLWWGDDRWVPRDHPLSNVLPADAVLLGSTARSGQSGFGEDGIDVLSGREPGVPMPAGNVHPFPVTETVGDDHGPGIAAARYEAQLRDNRLDVVDGFPVFDLVIVGIGPDGHLMSVFPGSTTWDETAWALPVPAPTHVEPHVSRVTLNPRVLDVARNVLAVAPGAAKADVLARVFGPERDPRQIPAQAVRRPGVVWLVDEAAAEGLRSERPATD